MFSGPSNFVESVDTAFWVVMLISVVFLVLVTVLMILFVIKYNRKRHPKAVNIHGNISLEITWTVVPTILVLVMFWFGWTGYKKMSTVPENAMKIEVTAQMWKWGFKYENGVQSDTLYLPVNTDVNLKLKSLDVNHSFFIPAFRVKKDVIPNRMNEVWFNATEVDTFYIACAEYCGLNHSNMYASVIVLPAHNFNFWLNNMAKLAEQKGKQSQQQDTTQTKKDSTGQNS